MAETIITNGGVSGSACGSFSIEITHPSPEFPRNYFVWVRLGDASLHALVVVDARQRVADMLYAAAREILAVEPAKDAA